MSSPQTTVASESRATCACQCQPSTYQGSEWIDYPCRECRERTIQGPVIRYRYGEALPDEITQAGKWLPFFLKSDLDAAWLTAKDAIDNQVIPHVTRMKVSTAAPSTRRAGPFHAIVMYCNSICPEEIEATGKAIRSLFNYTHTQC